MSTPADAPPPWDARELMASHSTREWVDGAACAQTDPEIFFPNKGQPAFEAKVVCLRCPVKAECLEFAVTSPMRLEGVWGGKTLKQRMEIRRQRGIRSDNNYFTRQCGTEAGAKRHWRAKEPACPACLAAANNAKKMREQGRRA